MIPKEDFNQFMDKTSQLQNNGTQDLKKVLFIIIHKWYFFVIALLLGLICAFVFVKYTFPTYKVSIKLLVDEENKGDLMEDYQYPARYIARQSNNLDNQIMILSSKILIERTLDELPFEIEYYRRGLFNKLPFLNDNPISVLPSNPDSLPRDVEFRFKSTGNNMFTLDAESKDTFSLHLLTTYDESIKTSNGSFRIVNNNNSLSSMGKGNKLFFISHSKENLIESYFKRLKVEPASRKGTILSISLEGTNKEMDKEFLNKLVNIFIDNSLDKKNEEAIRTIQFIDNQLIGISDSLIITENKLQQFRSTNRVMDLSAQGQVIIDQAMNLENEKARIEIESNYYAYLADYLQKDNIGEVPIAPATMGITDPGLTRLVTDLADLQGQLYSKSLGEKNPLQSQLAQRIRSTKEALRETLNGVIRANNLARNENLEQIRTVNARATALPVTERQLLGIEREFKLNNELYTFLLEKRAIAQIQKASNTPGIEIIDPSRSDLEPVKPKTTLIYFFAFVAGLFIPFLGIWFFDTFDNRVRKEEEIKEITDLPIIGHLPRNNLNKYTIVLQDPDSITSEAFRSLRSRLHFFIKDIYTPVILITSSSHEEGKTYTSINLASIYSLMGKKTILLGFDLRKPKIYDDFGLDNQKGITTWLMGQDSLQDIIKETSNKNLFIIPSGPLPPNPYELSHMDKTDELLILLKERFDYILIDASPIGTFSDAYHLASKADHCILIIRQNKTLHKDLKSTIKGLQISDIKRVSLAFNDLKQGYENEINL